MLFSVVNNYIPIGVSSRGLSCNIALLLLMLVSLVLSIMANGWKMNKFLSVIMLLLYVGFIVVALLLEKNILTCFI